MRVAGECAKLLAQSAEAVCKQLLPNGKVKSGKYYAGSVGGEEGSSLVVELRGTKAGVWADFAANNGDKQNEGDLVDLWAAVNAKSIRECIPDIARHCGVDLPQVAHEKRYKKPNVPQGRVDCPDEILAWFKERGIEKETLADNYVKWVGDSIAYPCFHDRKVALIRYRKHNAPHNQRFKSSVESRPTMFGWPKIDNQARTLFITEGFEDCMILQQWGIQALSVPFGAGAGAKQAWIETEHDSLLQFDDIVLCMDADSAGEAAIKEICERLGQHRCRVLRLGGMDITDWWRAGGNPERFIELAKASKPLELDVVKSLAAFQGEAMEFILGGGFESAEDAFEFPFKDMENWRLLDGTVTAWTGHTGAGKSTVTNLMSIYGMKQGYKVLIASMELPGKQTAVKYGYQLSGRLNPTREYLERCFEYANPSIYIYNVVDNTNYLKLLEAMEYAFKRHGTKLFIIDSLLKLGIREDDSDGLVEAINSFGRFAKKFGAQVWIVAHQTKPAEKFGKRPAPTEYGIRGTGSAADLFEQVIGVYRVPPVDGKPHLPDMQLCPLKFRYASAPPERRINFWMDKSVGRYSRDSRCRVEELVPTEGTAEEHDQLVDEPYIDDNPFE